MPDQGQTVVSDITSLAKEQARSCLLTQCITKEVFPYYKFILLDSELNFGGRLQERVCSKLNVTHDQSRYWEMNRERVRTKLTRKRNNVTEAVRKKMTGTSLVESYLCQNINWKITNTCTSSQLYIENIIENCLKVSRCYEEIQGAARVHRCVNTGWEKAPGWSDEGMMAFEKYVEAIRKDVEEDKYAAWENAYLDVMEKVGHSKKDDEEALQKERYKPNQGVVYEGF
jgi:hypothetical protein